MPSNKFLLYIIIGIGALLSSCSGHHDEPVTVHRTVLAYIVADNNGLGSSLVTSDIREMLTGAEQVDLEHNALLIYVDDDSTPRLYKVVKDKGGKTSQQLISEYEERASTDPAVISSVLQEVVTKHPAERYGFVYWSHGEGWVDYPLTRSALTPPLAGTTFSWMGQDKGGGTDVRTNITDLARVLKSAFPARNLDFILFDACFMQSVEALYDLRDCADYIIGSPTEIPGPGAPYDEIVPHMFTTTFNAESLADAYYQNYYQLYTGTAPLTNDYWTAGVSISVVKTSALENLARVTAQVLPDVAPNRSSLLATIYNYNKRSSQQVSYYDFANLMKTIVTDATALSQWEQAFGNAVTFWKTTPQNYSITGMFSLEDVMTGTHGLTHYIPLGTTTATDADVAYRRTSWYKAAGLDKLGW